MSHRDVACSKKYEVHLLFHFLAESLCCSYLPRHFQNPDTHVIRPIFLSLEGQSHKYRSCDMLYRFSYVD
jgi:hypothetical protein